MNKKKHYLLEIGMIVGFTYYYSMFMKGQWLIGAACIILGMYCYGEIVEMASLGSIVPWWKFKKWKQKN